MSTANSSNHKAVGTTEVHHLTPKKEGDDYYGCWWDLKGPIMSNMREELKSPIFTVPNRDECKWYLSVHPLDDEIDKGELFFASCLHLDSTSECKEAVVKFRIDVDVRPGVTRVRSCKSRTFKFIKNSKNNSAILSMMCSRELQHCWSDDEDDEDDGDDNSGGETFYLNVRCIMMIEKVILEDSTFSNDIGSILKNNRFTDVVISVGEKKFPAHRIILSARSSVFAAMFTHNTTENQGIVDIKDLGEEIVEEMLRYIYTGSVEKMNELAQDLLIAADKYDLKGLIKQCEGALIENLSSSNAFDLLLFAVSHNASHLKFETINLIRRRKTEMIETEGWESLSKSNPALCREISEARLHPEPESHSDADSENFDSDYSMTDSDDESVTS